MPTGANCEDIRVLFICLDMDPFSVQGDEHTGAAHLYVRETLEMLDAQNIHTLAITRWDSKKKPNKQQVGSRVTLVRIQIGQIDVQPKSFLWRRENSTHKQIQAALVKHNFMPNVLHTVYWYSGKVGLLFLEQNDIYHVHTVTSLGKVKHAWQNTLSEHDLAREKTEQILFESADALVCVSQQEKQNLLNLYSGINADKVFPIGRGIDPAVFAPIPLPEVMNTPSVSGIGGSIQLPKVILFVGRLIESKQLGRLLPLYGQLLQLQSVDVPPLWIVGGTKRDIQYAREQYVLGNPDLAAAERTGRIWWWGALPRGQLPFIYRRALVTCVPSTYEAGARVILESMACGTPVIMTRTGYSDELVMNGINGFVADIEDKEAWLSYLRSMIADRIWQTVLAHRAYVSVLPYYSLQEFQNRHWHVYKSVLSENRASTKYANSVMRTIGNLYPNWEVPEIVEQVEQVHWTDLDIQVWISENLDMPHGEMKIQQLPSEKGSSKSYLIEKGDSIYHLKGFEPKRSFFRTFWPAREFSAYKSASARFSAECYFGQDQMFLPILKSELRHFLVVREYASEIEDASWDADLLLNAINMVRSFQSRQRDLLGSDLKLLTSSIVPRNLAEAQEISRERQEFNAQYRGGENWYTPLSLISEIAILRHSLNHELFLPKDLEPIARRGIDFFDETLLCCNSDIGIIWGGCRPSHILMNKQGDLAAIDAETAGAGEPEYDFGSLLWWYLDLRNAPAPPKKLAVVTELYEKWEAEQNQKALSLGWTWMLTMHFILWDLARGHKQRIKWFASFLEGYPKLWSRLGL